MNSHLVRCVYVNFWEVEEGTPPHTPLHRIWQHPPTMAFVWATFLRVRTKENHAMSLHTTSSKKWETPTIDCMGAFSITRSTRCRTKLQFYLHGSAFSNVHMHLSSTRLKQTLSDPGFLQILDEMCKFHVFEQN